ncbi:MAG: trimethylamine methyltransferase family protein [Desulfosarcinaceae bacterium]|nr:trimethylamine methyltransferase family protein [Desulfosarcinaceae bacterium]
MHSAIPRNISFDILSKEKIERIHAASLHLIEKVGMIITGERTCQRLREAGAASGADGRMRIPATLVEQALESVPKSLTLYTRDGEPNMVLDANNPVYFGTHADQLAYVDPETGATRDFLKNDTATMCKIAAALPNLRFILSVGMSKDVHPEVQSQITFLETVRHFDKTINFSTNDIASLQEIIDMAAIVAGGHDALAQRPFIFNYCEPIPPLTHPVESTEKLWISAEHRIPVVYMPYCMMGGTAPMSPAGALAQCNAEVLVGLVITQLVTDGAPFIYGAMPSIMDMKTTIGSYGAAEFHLLVAAASEMANYYSLPFYGTAGCTDAKTLDEQAVSEATMEIFSTILSKANIVHDIGVADHCNSVCPELVVLADEVIEMLTHYGRGISVDTEALCLEVIEAVGPGGQYLNEPHTLQHFRSVFYPHLFSRQMNQPAASQIRTKIREKIAHILDTHEVPELNETVRQELSHLHERYMSR